MVKTDRLGPASALLGLTLGCSVGCGADNGDLEGYRQHVATLDRADLKAEILDNAAQIADAEPAPEIQARLDIIEERVDELDGLIYRTQLDDGVVLKVYERRPGEVRAALVGDPSLVEGKDMEALSPVELFRALLPDRSVPEVLVEAEGRRATQVPFDPYMEAEPPDSAQPAVDEAASVTEELVEKHNVANHGAVSEAVWRQTHCPTSLNCFPNRGPASFTTAVRSKATIWNYMLNTSTGPGLGSLLVAEFSTDPGGDYPFFGDEFGPWFSGPGTLVRFQTAGTNFDVEIGSWCWILACRVERDTRKVFHSATFTLDPANRFHLFADQINPGHSAAGLWSGSLL